VAVEAACRKSRIYHSGAAAERIATAIREELGAKIDDEAGLVIKARIEKDLCTLSVDTSGDMLHKRGSKQAMAKAPMRETMAALFLRECGFDGKEPVLDPMCGSGTFVIEAAEIAMGLDPGRGRNFAFEQLASFDARAWEAMKTRKNAAAPDVKFHGSDRDQGAIKNAIANAARAGVADVTVFEKKAVSEILAPQGPPGLVICNPPYGARIGDKASLVDLYSAFGTALKERFHGWRVGLITRDTTLAKATGLPFKGKPHAVMHGGLRVHLFRTDRLS
jgi:putative N6-adenine-specific DNA methylase